MNFSEALVAIRERKKLRRAGWLRPQIYVVFQAGYPDGIAINKNTAEATGQPEGTIMKFAPYLMLVDTDGMNAPWTPYIIDLLAEDWEVVE